MIKYLENKFLISWDSFKIDVFSRVVGSKCPETAIEAAEAGMTTQELSPLLGTSRPWQSTGKSSVLTTSRPYQPSEFNLLCLRNLSEV